MARQKLPQQIDDCIKCTLPEDGSYRHCMNCRNKAVEECRRLEAELECVKAEFSEREQANDNIPLVNGRFSGAVVGKIQYDPKTKELTVKPNS